MSTTSEAMATSGDSLNAVRAALACAESRDEASERRGHGREPFVCAVAGLRIHDLRVVVMQAEQAERHRMAFESAQSALEDAQAGRPLRDGLGRHDAYTLTVDKLRATKADLATAAKVTAALRAEVETLRDQGAEAFDAMTAAYEAQAAELREVTAERDDAIAAVRSLLPLAYARVQYLAERPGLELPHAEAKEIIHAARTAIAKARRSP